MNKFQLSSEMILGESSELDAIFLPVTIDPHHPHRELFEQYHGDWIPNNQNEHHPQMTQTQGDEDNKVISDRCIGISKEQSNENDCNNDEKGASRVLMNAIITDSPDSKDWCYRATLTSIAAIIIIVLLLAFGHQYIHKVLVWLEKVEVQVSVSVLQLLFIIISFPIAWGLSLMMITCGYLFGCLYGPLVVTLCVTVGLAISFPVMQSMCAEKIKERFYSSKVEAMINILSGSHGMKVVALTRLTPIPFGLQNALFSLSSMSLGKYLVSSVGGLVPMTLLNCYMGSTLRTMEDLMTDDSNRLTGFFIFGGQILLTIVLSWFVVRKARGELKKAMDESDNFLPTFIPNDNCSKSVFVEYDGL